MSKQLLVSIQSDPAPQPGQKNRSSDNFQFKSLPQGDLEIDLSGNPNAGNISFNIMKDVSLGSDPVILKSVHNGQQAPAKTFKTKTDYYIASPQQTGGQDFVVEFFALT